MAAKLKNYDRFLFLLISVLGVFRMVQSQPEIEGPKEIIAHIGDDIAISCYANESITWYRYFNKTKKSEIIDENSSNHHFRIEFPENPDYTDWPDTPDHRNEEFTAILYMYSIEESDSGIFLCMHEQEDHAIYYTKIANNHKDFFASVSLIVEVVKPIIDVGKTVVVPAGGSINVTCSGGKPVTWVILNNHTWGVQHTEDKTKNKYFSTLQITNVNYTDVGYLVCKFVDEELVLYDDFNHKGDIPASSTYLFVKDVNHLLVQSDFHEISAKQDFLAVVPCKPTFPDVHVELRALDDSEITHAIFDPMKGFILNEASKKNHEGFWQCNGKFGAGYFESQLLYISVFYSPIVSSVNLTVKGEWQTNALESDMIHTFDVIEGDVMLINCSTRHPRNSASIMWEVPQQSDEKSRHQVLQYDTPDRSIDSRLITDVSKEKDSGIYSCYVTNNHLNSSAYTFALNVFSPDSSHLMLKAQNGKIFLPEQHKYPQTLKWIIFFRAYPAIYLKWSIHGETKIIYKIEKTEITHDRPMIKRKEHYEIKINWAHGEISLKIYNPSIRDTGIYILSAEVPGRDSIKRNLTLSFFKEAAPQKVQAKIGSRNFLKEGESISIECSAYGYPFPSLKIFFKSCQTERDCVNHEYIDVEVSQLNDEVIDKSMIGQTLSGKSSIKWTGVAKTQGYYTCMASNEFGAAKSSEELIIISDSELGETDVLQVEITRNEYSYVAGRKEHFIEGDYVVFLCRGNSFKTSSPIYWTVKTPQKSSFRLQSKNNFFQGSNFTLHETSTRLSHISRIETRITKKMDGINLTCFVSSPIGKNQSMNISVIDANAPVWASDRLKETHYVMNENEKLNVDCAGSGIPKPSVIWFKNGEKILPDNNDRRISLYEGSLSIEFLFPEDSGKYLCRIENREGILEDFFTLEVKDPDAAPQFYLIIIIAVVSGLFLLLVIILAVKFYRDRKADLMFKLETQKRFIEGNPQCLNPDLDLGEQAELLPYDNRFEFPRDRVTIESLLGSGAFGNVFKATAVDLISGTSKTTVAVKMLKSSANAAQMKTLVSELKIMIHIGRHVNIVNLLGACSKNMASKGELLLIVEYCRHGSILEYMRRHKSEFLDQINDKDKIDPNMPYYRKRSYSNPRASLKPTYAQLDIHRNSKYYSSETLENSSEKKRKISHGNLSQPTGRVRLKSDGGVSASSDGTVNTDMTLATSEDNYINEITLEQRGPLCSKDLLHWAYQIANGMFYLSEKKVIHGDLAARNILLADKNVVKISDFGLSKNIYKQEHYKKKSECPLPVKWLALEALQDSIFSTHSDVWSYGVVLWEIFTLGSNPYAGVEVDASFVTKLNEGLRLRHPTYATSDLYNIMMQCWEKYPNNRPSFRELEKVLGDMLGETEKQMYMTLNADYEENNYISEHLEFLHTPSYDTRMRNFFTDKDDMGYEKALVSGNSAFYRENGACLETDVTSHEHFELGPVPLRRKSNIPNRVQSTFEEKCNLLEGNRDTEYLVMSAPADEGSSTNSGAVPKTKSEGLCTTSNAIYANVAHLTTQEVPNIEIRRSSEEIQINISNCSSPPATVGVEGNIFNFNALAENDSVFGSEGFDDDVGKCEDAKKPSNNNYPRIDRTLAETYHNKHDSGIYSPNILQNNPIYTTSSVITDENNKNHSNRIFHSREKGSIRPERNDKESVANERKQRNQSDSSSGFGSLIDDPSNSLEKCKCNAKEKSLIRAQTAYLETECV